MLKRFFIVAAIAALLIGCANEPNAPTPIQEDGGTITVIELPDSYRNLLDSAMIIEDDPGLSPGIYQGDPEIFPPGTYDHYSIEIVWGHLGDSPVVDAAATKWDGSLGVNSPAALVPAQLIDFERGEDWIVPSPGLNPMSWVSQTHGRFDGIRFEMFVRTDIMTPVAPELTFKTELFQKSWFVFDLDEFREVYSLDNSLQVSIRSRKITTSPCPNGFMGGRWVFKDRRNGYFFGHWLAEFGLPVGYMFGRFHTDDEDNRTFEGYWMGLDNKFVGKLKGEWSFNETRETDRVVRTGTDGTFIGRFTDRNSDFVGSLEGRFGIPITNIDQSVDGYRPSKFKGRWWIDCPDIQSE